MMKLQGLKLTAISIAVGFLLAFLIILEFSRFRRTYRVALIGDSLINIPSLEHNLIGKLNALLPDYLIEFINYGANGAEIKNIQYYLPRALYSSGQIPAGWFGVQPGQFVLLVW